MLVNVNIKTHSQLLDERTKIVEESIELMRRQSRSNQKYAQKMNRLMVRLMKLERELYGQKDI